MRAHLRLQQQVLTEIKSPERRTGLGFAASPSLPYKRASLPSGNPCATRESIQPGRWSVIQDLLRALDIKACAHSFFIACGEPDRLQKQFGMWQGNEIMMHFKVSHRREMGFLMKDKATYWITLTGWHQRQVIWTEGKFFNCSVEFIPSGCCHSVCYSESYSCISIF